MSDIRAARATASSCETPGSAGAARAARETASKIAVANRHRIGDPPKIRISCCLCYPIYAIHLAPLLMASLLCTRSRSCRMILVRKGSGGIDLLPGALMVALLLQQSAQLRMDLEGR